MEVVSLLLLSICSVRGQHEIHQFWGGSKSQLTLWVVRLFPINNSRRKRTGSLAGSISTGQTYPHLCHHHRGKVILFLYFTLFDEISEAFLTQKQSFFKIIILYVLAFPPNSNSGV